MGRIGRIVPIRKEYSKSSVSLEAALAQYGFTRFPGTSLKLVPYKESNGKFRTGMDPNALYIRKLQPEAQEVERKRAQSLKEELEEATGLDLGPLSDYYKRMFDETLDHTARAAMYELKDEDNIFDLDNPYQAITFAWLSRHPQVASSYQAWERGEYPSSTKFYVADEMIEQEISYKKKTAINKAVGVLEAMSLEDRRKVARLLGLPVSDSSKEIYVYNLLDSYIKAKEVEVGRYVGADPLTLFNKIATLDSKILGVKDMIEQAVRLSIYREDKDGTIREGGIEIAKNTDDLAVDLLKSKNQDKLLALDEKLKAKKIATV